VVDYDRRRVIVGPYHRAMSRRADPHRIAIAKRAGVTERLAGVGVLRPHVEQWLEAWVARTDRPYEWNEAFQWIVGEAAAGRKPSLSPNHEERDRHDD
jgi:hypothetical protein